MQLNIFQILLSSLPELFVERRTESRYFLELIGKVRNTAVIEFVGNFGQVHFIVQHQFLSSFNLMNDDEMLDCDAFDFRKCIGQIGIVVT